MQRVLTKLHLFFSYGFTFLRIYCSYVSAVLSYNFKLAEYIPVELLAAQYYTNTVKYSSKKSTLVILLTSVREKHNEEANQGEAEMSD